MYYQQSLWVNYKILFVQPPYQLLETLLKRSYHFEVLRHLQIPISVHLLRF